ncbi:sporulation protein [Halorussus sp. MSC15.2]|uniref:sporulation protein n=1 Tax=Halorussus sp. MSC15.2 TaxID=2283638 RepID=UPI0013D287BF|nr:sporulation protein [Halorussus sp. MSC15.2]NEU58714.1 sporulation protein [Halorussus sp. MSC15.2]
MDENNVLTSHSVSEGTIEISLSQNYVVIGESTDIDVTFRGTNCQWEIKEIALALNVPYRTGDDFQRATIDRFTLVSDATFETELTETRTSTITIPWETPETVGSIDVISSIKIFTEEETTTYERHIDVTAPQLQAVFKSMIELGFTPRDFECVEAAATCDTPFVQRLVFQPVEGSFQSKFDKLELLCRSSEGTVTVFAAGDGNVCPKDMTNWENIPQTKIERTDEGVVYDHIKSFIEEI